MTKKKFIGSQYPLKKTPRGIFAPLNGVDQIKADLLQLLLTNPGERCITGDTKIPLANSEEFSIKDLVGKESFWVYSYDSELDMIVAGKAQAFKTIENAELYEVKLDNNETVRCTSNHLWLMRDGNYKATIDLNEGDSLMPLYRNKNTSGYERIYQPYLKDYRETHLNFVIGSREQGVREVVHHVDLNKKNNAPDNLQWMTCKDHKELHKIISNAFMKKFKEDPEFKADWAKKQKEGLLKYYENNYSSRKGVKLTDETKEKLSKNKKEFYKTEEGEKIKEILSEKTKAQLKNYNHWEGKKHSEESKNKMKKKRPSICGENNPSKRPEVREKIKLAWEKRRIKNNHKVNSVNKLDYKEDCYDLHVEKYHNFGISVGVFVHNCMLPEFGTPLRKLHFELNDPRLIIEAKQIIANSISKWEPRIEIENIEITNGFESTDFNNDEEYGSILGIKIKFYDPNRIDRVEELKLELPFGDR